MTQHAQLSPSAAHRWLRCAGSVHLAASVPDESSEYADEGTAAHELAAWSLREGRPAATYIGQTVEVKNDDGTVRRSFIVDEEMASYVQVYVDSITDRVHAGAQLLVEQRVDTGIPGPDGGTVNGTADAIVLAPLFGVLDVNDLKYGKGIVVYASWPIESRSEAYGPVIDVDGQLYELNEQLSLYALGALKQYQWLADFPLVRIAIHQPRCDHYSVAEIDAESLLLWGDQVQAAAGKISSIELIGDDPNNHLTPSDKGCQWCPAKCYVNPATGEEQRCPALEEHVNQTVMDDFSDVPDLTEHGFAQAMERVELVEQWLAAIKTGARALAEQGRLPGWVLDQGRQGNRKWKDAEAVKKRFRNTYRMKKAEYVKETMLSPAQIEKLFKDKPKQWEDMQALIERGPPSLKLVRASEATNPVTIANDFGKVKK